MNYVNHDKVKIESSIFKSSNKSIFHKFFYIFFYNLYIYIYIHIYIKLFKILSAKYNQENKEGLQKTL